MVDTLIFMTQKMVNIVFRDVGIHQLGAKKNRWFMTTQRLTQTNKHKN